MWKYKNVEVADTSIPTNAVGFIYMITQVSTNKKYIGKKLLTKAATKQVKGVKKKIRKESDWKTYYSSSPTLLKMIEEFGVSDFNREILCFCNNKSELLYAEEYFLYMSHSMLSVNWINENIRSKVMKKWFSKNAEAFKKTITEISPSNFT